jgi:hypothetical protein
VGGGEEKGVGGGEDSKVGAQLKEIKPSFVSKELLVGVPCV